MSAPIALTQECCKTPCTEPESIQVPGPAGVAGADGVDGEDGLSPVTTVTAQFLMPAEGANVTVAVGNSEGLVPGQGVIVQTGGTMQVISKPNNISVILQNLENTASALYPNNAAPTTAIPSGSLISPAGFQGNAGVLSGAAGGHLAGTYPNPTIGLNTAKGALIVGDGATVDDLAVGANGTVLHGRSTQALGVQWSSLDMTGVLTSLSGALPIANGGTSAATKAAAMDALSPVTTRGDLIYRNATTNTRLALGASNTIPKSNGTDLVYGKITAQNMDSGFVVGTHYTAITHRFLVDLNLPPASDTPIPISFTRWIVRRVVIENATVSLAASAARIGIYTAAGKLGQTIVTDPNSELTNLVAADKYRDVAMDGTMITDIVLTPTSTIYLHLSVAHGTAASLMLTIFGEIMS